MSVEDVLRDTLHAAPEPPDGIGLGAASARRRAKAIKRRRYAAVTSAVTCVAVVVAGLALVSPARRATDVTPVGPAPAGEYPDWPRRGNAPATLDAEAVAAYDEYLREDTDGVSRGSHRVLYADERSGNEAVVVLHAVASAGGERIVVLTGTSGDLSVYLDVPAPEPGAEAVSVVLDREEYTPGNICDRGEGEPPQARLLVLAAPGSRTSVEWTTTAPPTCRDGSVWTRGDTALGADATVLMPVPVPRPALFAVGVPGAAPGRVFHRGRPALESYRRLVPGVPESGPVPWTPRIDVSRALELRDAMTQQRGLQKHYGGSDCRTLVVTSLPDGTPLVLCALRDVRDPLVLLVTESRDRENRVYLEIPPDPLPTAFVAVVDGLSGRWLVVAGDEGLGAAELRTAAGSREIPLTQGVGWLRLDREPPADAQVWTPGYGPGGGMAIMDRTGRVLDLP
jgi:hypothetical protein